MFHLILNGYLLYRGRCWARGGGGSTRPVQPPEHIVEWQTAPPISGTSYRAGPRSVVVPVAGSARWTH